MPVQIGQKAPIDGLFTAHDGSHMKYSAKRGDVAQSAGRFCVDGPTVSLLQRAFSVSHVSEFDGLLQKKDIADATTTETTESTVNRKRSTTTATPLVPECIVASINWTNPQPECLAPQLATKRQVDDPDSYFPSVISYVSSAPATRGVEDFSVARNRSYSGKILVYGTSKYLLETVDGRYFSTGHHSSELFLPMYHFDRAGFDFDFVTSDGGAVAVEEWSFALATADGEFPAYEDKLRATYDMFKTEMSTPKLTADIPTDLSGYKGIFIPGGHGPLIEEHLDADLGVLLRQAHSMNLPVLSLCHGPNALRSGALGGEFPFAGYNFAMFPDAQDVISTSFGYLPSVPKEENQAERILKELGMNMMNTAMDDTVVEDRELLTGSSQLASQKFSVMAVAKLFEAASSSSALS